jgi:16S rRNA (cytidine1402-2'-O)-methyltransferase
MRVALFVPCYVDQFYPQVAIASLELLEKFRKDKQIIIGRELTKMFEETNKNTLTALAAHYEKTPPKGEIVIVIEGRDAPKNRKDRAPEEEQDEDAS